MKVIIDIPEEAFNYIRTSKKLGYLTDRELAGIIAKGEPFYKDKHVWLVDMNGMLYNLVNFCCRNELPFDELLCLLGVGCCEMSVKAIKEGNDEILTRFRDLKKDIKETLQKEGVNIE